MPWVWAWYSAGLNAAALGDHDTLDKVRCELQARDPNLAREFEKRVESIVAKAPSC